MTDTTRIHGTVADDFEPVRDAFAENFRERDELGAACAVYHRGEKVVDLWGGFRDVAAAVPWDEETMILLFSTSKGMAATAMALAHSRGLFELDDRIADHWPAFGQHGKSEITVRQLLGPDDPATSTRRRSARSRFRPQTGSGPSVRRRGVR